MEKTIKIAVQRLRDDLDRLENNALYDIGKAFTDREKLEVFWQYSKPLVKIANLLDESGVI